MAHDEKAVYELTGKGKGELKSAQTALSMLELKLLVLMDGRANLGRIFKAFSSQPQAELVETIERMRRSGLIVDRDPGDAGGEHGGI